MARWKLCLVLLVGIVGCGHDGLSPAGVPSKQAFYDESYSTGDDSADHGGEHSREPARSTVLENEITTVSAEQTEPIERKVIYNASLTIIVGDLEETKAKIDSLIEDSGGFLSQFQEDRMYGDQLGGNWVVRVPSDKFRTFVEDAEDLGVPESQQIQAEEVTEQFVDLEARLKVQRQVEQEMLELIKDLRTAGKFSDLEKAIPKLGEVRVVIEQIEGRLRYLRDRVAMSTITITAREDKSYVPPQAPTFATMIGTTFGESISAMLLAGRGLVLVVVAIAPWLVLLAVLLSPVLLIFAVQRRKSRTKQAHAQ